MVILKIQVFHPDENTAQQRDVAAFSSISLEVSQDCRLSVIMAVVKIFETMLFAAFIIVNTANNSEETGTVSMETKVQDKENIAVTPLLLEHPGLTTQSKEVIEQAQDGEVTFGRRIQQFSEDNDDNQQLNPEQLLESNSNGLKQEEETIPIINDALKLVSEIKPAVTSADLDWAQAQSKTIGRSKAEVIPLKNLMATTTAATETAAITTATTTVKPILEPVRQYNSLFPQYVSSKEDDRNENTTIVSRNTTLKELNPDDSHIETTTEVSNDVTTNKTDERLLDIETKTESFESPIRLFKSAELSKGSSELQESADLFSTNLESDMEIEDDAKNFVIESLEESEGITTAAGPTSSSTEYSKELVAFNRTTIAYINADTDNHQIISNLPNTTTTVVPSEGVNLTLHSAITEERRSDNNVIAQELSNRSILVDANGALQLAETMTDEITATFSSFDNDSDTSVLLKNETYIVNDGDSRDLWSLTDQLTSSSSTDDKHLFGEKSSVVENASSSGITSNLSLNSVADKTSNVSSEHLTEHEVASGKGIINEFKKIALSTAARKSTTNRSPSHTIYVNRRGLIRRQKFKHLNTTNVSKTTSSYRTAPTVEGIVGLVPSVRAAKVLEQKNGYICLSRNSPEVTRTSSEGDSYKASEISVFVSLPLMTSRGTRRQKWHPYQMNCDTEEDEKGGLCVEWARSGLCTTHRPTMFLFCRKTCLCTGPPEY
uniref:ShKT domain-containing protein n=1 Tax=Syphacia muris TaxID=451379 RepID=A0A0N5ANL8_9BILA